jgi:transcription elongation factor GreA
MSKARAARGRVVEPMSGQGSSDRSDVSASTRDRLEEELAQLRDRRRSRAAQLGGEDPDDQSSGDSGDQAVQLEGLDDLARIDRRISEIEHLIADPDLLATPGGLSDGTVVTLRFPDGDEATYRVVAIAEEAPADGQNEVVTADSPLGRALAGRRAGDTVTYRAPDGDIQVDIVAMTEPG